ncbi:MAG: hypothetical protein CSA38_04185 [Flavobacteriales bacterium]|nr:MAG: hypothetical protein CSA38_04185 [Flavobacteriales bacterium]
MKKTILSAAAAFLCMQAQAQTKDIGVTISPTAQYNWWDENTGIENGMTVGGRVGFSFGRNFEIRGVYEQSLSLKNTLDKYKDDFPNLVNSFSSDDVEIKRYGAEFKVNLTNKGVSPYVTLGAGIQEMEAKDNKVKQIYANGGLGIKLRLSDRIVLNLEGKHTVFNMNPNTALGLDLQNSSNTLESVRMGNWSAQAGIQFYLAGRRPGQMSSLDKAYYNKYSGGFSGVSISAEPMLSYVDFNDDSNLRDTYLLGASLGFNFNKYISLRAYYLQSTQDKKIQTKWDEMAMYGGDVVARLNVAKGVVPYLTLGGGYLNQLDSYVGEDEALNVDNSSYYAKGGLGLTIPLGRSVELFGEAGLMYTSEKAEHVSSPDELVKHMMYNGGVRFNIGKSKANTDDALQTVINENNRVYESRLAELQSQLDEAYAKNDTEKVVEIMQEKKAVEQRIVEDVQQAADTTEAVEIYNRALDDKIRLTPAELEEIIETAVDEVDAEYGYPNVGNVDYRNREGAHHHNHNHNHQSVPTKEYLDLKNDLKKLNQKIDNVENRAYERELKSQKPLVVDAAVATKDGVERGYPRTGAATVERVEGKVVRDAKGNKKKVASLMYYKGVSGFVGVNFGQQTAMNVGVRGHYEFSNSNFELMPEAYLGLGDPNGFGLSANVIYPFNIKKNKYILKPYLGAGLGFNLIDGGVKFGTNLIAGTYVNLWKGKLYVDYTARDFTKNNQIAVGYKFTY